MTRGFPGRRSLPAIILGGAAAVALGVASRHLAPAAIGLLTLLPLVSHVRWVGLRRAVAEPSVVTIIVGFYVFIFPLRGLVIAANGYTDVFLARGVVSGQDLVAALLLASLATTALVEAYYFVRGPERPSGVVAAGRLVGGPRAPRDGVLALAGILGVLALAALVGILIQFGGLKGAQAELLSHSQETLVQGQRTIPESVWWVLAVPAVWCAAYVAVDAANDAIVRGVFASLGIFIVLAQIVVFGSRLNAILALIGVWVVCHYSGRPIPVRAILAAVPAVILLSVPIVSERPGGDDARLPTLERYSRIAGYSVLDASLAVRQEPAEIRSKLRDPRRWLDLPAYLAPSAVWPDKPNIDARRLGLYVAQTLGDRNQQATGFPTTYVTEGWLYAGWPAVLLMSVLLGALLGWLHCKLVGSPSRRAPPAALLCYCFVVTVAFGYYKDGDILVSFVGNWRAAVYLGIALLATGVWTHLRRPRDWVSPEIGTTGVIRPPVDVPYPRGPQGGFAASEPEKPTTLHIPYPRGPQGSFAASEPEKPTTLLYVMSEYPSVSETFVVNEAAAVSALGVPVVGYALRRGSAVRSAAEVELICRPPTRLQLLVAAVGSLPAFLVEVWSARRARLAPREIARLLLAMAHASYAAPSSKRARVTHVHAHFLGRSADVASALAPRLGCRWTATAHGDDVYAPVEPGLLRRRLRSVAAVACANRGLQTALYRHSAPVTLRTKTVHCGVDTASLTFSPGSPGRAPHLVTVGRLVATKGHWTILEAAAPLMRRDSALRWTVVGDGPLREELTRDPRYRGLSPRMTFTGALDHAATLELIGRATAFVLPCELGMRGESDGVPVTLMEAMALGVPVVTTPIAGIPELVIHYETGFLVSPKDPHGLIAVLEEILYRTSPPDLDRIRRAARRKIELEFDLVHEAGSLIDLLKPYLPDCSGEERGTRA